MPATLAGMIRSVLCAAVLALAALPASPAQAWGHVGHRLVARLAEPQLSPQARAEVQRLLAREGFTSLAEIATWADELREHDPDLGRRSAKWHYVNIGEQGCQYDAATACRNGDCVVAAVDAQAAILADRSRSDAERLQALKFVVHFVGDIHQPMHAGYGHDRGGNTFQINLDGKGSNLHALWDSRLLASSGLREDAHLQALQQRPALPAASIGPVGPGAAQGWAEQACRIAIAPGVYPPRARISQRYLDQHRPTAEAQLRLAGDRLGGLLTAILAPGA